jgi:hemoglobin
MYCMRKAMHETVDDLPLAQQLLNALDQLATHMINTK